MNMKMYSVLYYCVVFLYNIYTDVYNKWHKGGIKMGENVLHSFREGGKCNAF